MTLRRPSSLAFASALLGSILAGPTLAAAVPTIACDGTNLCIDLAGSTTRSTWPITPGAYTLKFLNRKPNGYYRVTVDNVPYLNLPGPLTVPTNTSPGAAPVGAAGTVNDCDNAYAMLVQEYNDAKDESGIRDLNSNLHSALKECEETEAAQKRQALLDATTDVQRPVSVGEHTQLIVMVERLASQGANAEAVATFGPYTFATPRPSGQWLMYYGANYIWDDDEAYFAKPNQGTTPQSYTINEKSDAGGGTFAASLYFMWFSAKEGLGWHCLVSCNSNDRFLGLTAGIGFDFDNPTVFLGYGGGWGYNVMVTGGVAMSKVGRLAGQYRTGEVVLEPLTESALRDETYEPALYLGLAFRFGDNPFKASSKAQPKATETAGGEPTQ